MKIVKPSLIKTIYIKPLIMPTYNLKINGKLQAVEADSDTPLLWVLRDHVNLVGTKFGCGIAQCGACTVHINGNATRSCSLPVSKRLMYHNVATAKQVKS